MCEEFIELLWYEHSSISIEICIDMFLLLSVYCVFYYSVAFNNFEMYIKFAIYTITRYIYISQHKCMKHSLQKLLLLYILPLTCLQKCFIGFPGKYHSSVLIICFTSQTSILRYEFSSIKLL